VDIEELKIRKGLLINLSPTLSFAMTMSLQKDNTAVIGIVRRDKLMRNFHSIKITLTS
jgi:hypothetical protein